jgi:sugar phosphate isomerase/epimerase
MHLSLSVRIAEGFHAKEHAEMDLRSLADLARRCGYTSLCMRASQVGVHSPLDVRLSARQILSNAGLSVSMVTGDFDIVYNNDAGPACLRHIEPYIELAQQLGAPMLRVALKRPEDIAWAQRAADRAAAAGLQLVHQCHTLSLFETVEGIEHALRSVDRPNFGLIFEPANLELCGQPYDAATIRRLAPWIFNVYLQNQRLSDAGAMCLETWCRGPVRFDLIQIHDAGGVDFAAVLAGLHEIDYAGTVTVHQSASAGQTPERSAAATAEYLRGLL